MGYTHSSDDFSPFTKLTDTNFTDLMVYVDDIVLAGNNHADNRHVKAFLDQQFQIKELGPLGYFIALEVARSNQGTMINQKIHS